MSGKIDGGCLCGAVRYEVDSAPIGVTHCHCRQCRVASGAPVVTWGYFKTADITFTKGEMARFRSSSRAVRSFCPNCGTQIAFQEDAKPEITDLTVGSMDEPGAVAPEDHVWTSERIGWLSLDDRLPGVPRGHGS